MSAKQQNVRNSDVHGLVPFKGAMKGLMQVVKRLVHMRLDFWKGRIDVRQEVTTYDFRKSPDDRL